MLFIGLTYKNVMVRTTPIHFSSFYNKSFMKLEKTKNETDQLARCRHFCVDWFNTLVPRFRHNLEQNLVTLSQHL